MGSALERRGNVSIASVARLPTSRRVIHRLCGGTLRQRLDRRHRAAYSVSARGAPALRGNAEAVFPAQPHLTGRDGGGRLLLRRLRSRRRIGPVERDEPAAHHRQQQSHIELPTRVAPARCRNMRGTELAPDLAPFPSLVTSIVNEPGRLTPTWSPQGSDWLKIGLACKP